MGIRYDYTAMVRELQDLGFDAEQTARYDAAYAAAKLAAATLLCAMHGLRPEDLRRQLHHPLLKPLGVLQATEHLVGVWRLSPTT